jgi:4-hydroxybenzoate polyprenyltransferase
MTLKDSLNFIRWKNVFMIGLLLILIKYVLFESFELNVTLDHLHFALLTLSTMCIAIAGYIVNDINDIEADKINKPKRLYVGKKISRTKAYNLFIAFNSVGLILGMYLSYHVGHTSYFIIYVLTSLLLYQYAKYIKKKFLIGNLLVAFAVFLSIILPLVFDLLPVTNALNESKQLVVAKLVVVFALFGFFMTVIRELVKDLEDVKGDEKIGARSLPIVLGAKKTKGVVVVTTLLLSTAVAFFAFMLVGFDRLATVYLSLFVAAPLLYFIFYLWKAESQTQLHRSSALLKIVMLLGILTLLLIKSAP